MKVLELFAGGRSIGKVCDKLGWECFSVDIVAFENISLVKDVITLERKDIPFEPDVIWASPVCSAWSKSGWFHYWDTGIYRSSKRFVAKKAYANVSVEMVRKTIEIFSWFPNAEWFMENPQGLLYRHPIMNEFVRHGLHEELKRRLVTYCQYGDTVRKPTHIWTNSRTWKPKKHCENGDPCHLSSPRDTQKGTRSKKGSYERAVIPEALCLEILSSTGLQSVQVSDTSKAEESSNAG